MPEMLCKIMPVCSTKHPCFELTFLNTVECDLLIICHKENISQKIYFAIKDEKYDNQTKYGCDNHALP